MTEMKPQLCKLTHERRLQFMKHLLWYLLLSSAFSSCYSHGVCPQTCQRAYYTDSITTCSGAPLKWTKTEDTRFENLSNCLKSSTPSNLYITQPRSLSFLTEPVYHTSYAGESLNLNCSVSPSPVCYKYDGSCPTLSWFRDEAQLSVGNSTLSVSTNGSYYCKLLNGNYTIRSLPQIITFIDDSNVPLTFSNLIYNTIASSSFYQINDVTSVKIDLPPGGGSAFLDCTPSKPTSSTPTWLECRTCTDIPGNKYVKIVRADKDTEVVVCQVNSVVRTFSFKVTDATDPVFVVTPRSQTVAAGKSLTLYCLVNASSLNGSIQYSWYKNDDDTPLHTPIPQVLIINNINDSAHYTCSVTTGGINMSHTAYVNVIGRPIVNIAWSIEGSSDAGSHFVFVDTSKDINITAPTNITLFCGVSTSSNSTQSFSIFWYFRGQLVTANSLFPWLLNDSALFLSSNYPLDHFLSSYQCVVKGEYHWRSSQVRIKYTDKPNPPGPISVSQLPELGSFTHNDTYRISWDSPNHLSVGDSSYQLEYNLLMLHNFKDGSCPHSSQHALYTLRTSSTCILYDTFCDTLMFTGTRRFFVSAVVTRPEEEEEEEEVFSDYVYSDLDGNVPTQSCGIPNHDLGHPTALVLSNMSVSMTTNEADNKFDVTFNFDSISESYSSYYGPYNASWLMNIYYTYQVNYSCIGINMNIPVTHMHHNEATSNVYQFGCLLHCSWWVTLWYFMEEPIDKLTTAKMSFSTPALPPIAAPVLTNVSWNNRNGNNFTANFELHATCGVSNVTVRLNCSGSISYQVITDAITDIVNRSSVSISINDTYCWDQCRISISYSNDAGKSKWSNTLTLANWTNLDNYGFVQDNVNFTIMNSSFIRMNWELTDTMECLSSRRLYYYVKIQWIPEECSQKTSDPNYWEYKGSLNISLRDEFHMIDVGDSGHDHYCIRASFCGANLPCTESYVYDVNVFNRAGSSSSPSPSPSPTVGVSSSSAGIDDKNKTYFIIGGVVGGCILLAVFITCFTCCYCYYRKQKRKREQQQQRLITQVHEHEEQTVKLLDDEEESVTSEKTIVQSLLPNKPYDEEIMEQYLEQCQTQSRQYLRDIEEGGDHTELEPGDKEEQRPNDERPPPPLFVGAQKHKKSTITHLASNNEESSISFGGDRLHKLSPSANPPGVTVSVMLPPPSSLSLFPSSFQDDNGYTHHQDFHTTREGAAALNKTTPTSTKLDDIELDLLISPEDEEPPMTTPTTVSMLSLNNNNAPSTIGGLNVMQHPPINIQTSDYLPSVPLQALPTHTRPPTGRSTENTPIPSNSSSLLSLATVEGQGGGTSSGNESKQSKDSCLEPPGSFERNIRKNEMLNQGRRRMREGSRRTKGGRKSSSRQSFASRSLSNRSSSSSGILSSGGSTDSVFLSNPSIIRDPPRHPSNLSLTKTSSGGCPLPTGAGPSRTRRSSGFESDPNTPKSAQSIEGQNKGGLDMGTTFFPFPPTTLSSTINGSQNSLTALPQKDTIALQQSVVGDYIVEANNVTGMNVMSDQTKFPISAINAEYISEPTWPPPPFSYQKNTRSISPPPLSPHLLSPPSISPLSPSPPTSPFSFSPPVSPTKSFSTGLNQQKPATLPPTNPSRRSSGEDTKRRSSLQLTPVQELLNMKRNSLDSTNIHTPSLSTTSSFMTLQHQTLKTPTITTFSSNFSPSPFSSLSFPPLTPTPSTNSSLPCPATQASTSSSLYSTVSQLTPLKSMGSVSKSAMNQPVGPPLFSTPLGSLSSSKSGASFGLNMSQFGSNATGTDYLPAVPPVSPTRINLKQPSGAPTVPVINGGMRRQTAEENTSYSSIGRNDSRKQSLDYVSSSSSNPFTVPLSSSLYPANVTSTTAAQSGTILIRQTPTTPSYSGIPSLYSFKSPEQKSHPASSHATNSYLKVADSTVSQSQQLLDNGGLQSIINDELPSLPPELATVPVTPTRTDSVTSEVDDSYSIPSMTSSIQELINNNEEEEGDSMPFSIEQFIDESPSAAARTNDYIS